MIYIFCDGQCVMIMNNATRKMTIKRTFAFILFMMLKYIPRIAYVLFTAFHFLDVFLNFFHISKEKKTKQIQILINNIILKYSTIVKSFL